MRPLKGLSSILFIATAAACITQLGTVPLQDDNEKSVDKSSISPAHQEEKQSLDDCGYQEIVVDNPDKTKTIIIIPLECVDEPVDTVCDPAIEDPTKRYEADVAEKISL